MTLDHERYLSPFAWRYGSDEMRALWSEARKRRLWRRFWVALAQAQAEAGIVRPEQVADLRAHEDAIDIPRADALEADLRHDLMAEVRAFAEACPVGGGIIHLGATSMDVEDNIDALRVRDAIDLLLPWLDRLLLRLADQVDARSGAATMGFTHLQPAEPTTVGYRLAWHAQDLLEDRAALGAARAGIRGKGLKGAVGTSASYAQLLHGTCMGPADLEARVMGALGIDAWPVACQTAPRKQEFTVLSALASLGQSVYKFAFDLRILQSPPFGEWAEPFGARQVGSSAMPFKRNPIHAESVCSLARMLAGMPRVAWDNAANSLLERTLDDSANRRTVLPEAFLVSDEILRRTFRLVDGLRVDEGAAARLMGTYGVFAATERLLMEAGRRGGDRQELHEVIREHALRAWEAVRAGAPNPLAAALSRDPRVLAYLSEDEALACLDASRYVGDAPARARAMAARVRAAVHAPPPERS